MQLLGDDNVYPLAHAEHIEAEVHIEQGNRQG